MEREFGSFVVGSGVVDRVFADGDVLFGGRRPMRNQTVFCILATIFSFLLRGERVWCARRSSDRCGVAVVGWFGNHEAGFDSVVGRLRE